jgi:hypothetical protein
LFIWSNMMKDTIKEADLLLAELIGYATPDSPTWTQKHLTFEENRRLNRERNQYRIGNITEAHYRRIKRAIETRSETNYDFLHPRRPAHWDKVLRAYLDLPEDARVGITRDGIQRLIDYTHPETAREMKAQERQEAQARNEAKAEARRVRALSENKHQEWNPREKQNWAVTDDISESRKPRVIHRSKTGGAYWPWYLRWFEQFIGNLDWKLRFGRDKIEAGSMSSSLDRGHPLSNSPEFNTGYQFGAIRPGKKPSGNTRRLLGKN